jgi:hypothetical protein
MQSREFKKSWTAQPSTKPDNAEPSPPPLDSRLVADDAELLLEEFACVAWTVNRDSAAYCGDTRNRR